MSERTDRDVATREMRDLARRAANGTYTIALNATGRGTALPMEAVQFYARMNAAAVASLCDEVLWLRMVLGEIANNTVGTPERVMEYAREKLDGEVDL